MDTILKKIGIDETFTKPPRKQKVFNKVASNVPPRVHYNYMADLLMLPTTKADYKYLLVVVDLATNEFDIEPMKDKNASTVLESFQNMFKRKFIKKPYALVRTDSGSEFQGIFHKYLYDNSILHKVAMPNRHKQLANVESLNKQLGRLFNGYMNMKEIQTGKQFNEWDEIIGLVRTELNKHRKVKLMSLKQFAENSVKNLPKTRDVPKFKIGDIVHYKLDYPENALGHKQPTANFRVGDFRWSVPVRKIVKVIYMTDTPYYRYMLEGLPNVSYADTELMSSIKKESTYKVKEIIGRRTFKKQVQYLVWWDKHLKKNATWEPKKALIEDGLEKEINDYDKSKK